MDTEEFGEHLQTRGYRFFSGVPCSYLKPLINWTMTNAHYIAAVNEGDAVAACAGAVLGGQKSAVLMQNSGLTNALSPLTSLTELFGIPLLGFVTLRTDEPQHRLMGGSTESILGTLGIESTSLSRDGDEASSQLLVADNAIAEGRSFFFIVKKNTFSPVASPPPIPLIPPRPEVSPPAQTDALPLRREVLEALVACRGASDVFITTTGYTSRELYELGDHPGSFYMLGSLGCVGPCALGLALSRRDKNVIAIDGDGALLMRMGSLAAAGLHAPPNLLHIVLDNGAYESTGGQPTVAANTDFVQVAAGCGYRRVIHAHNLDELKRCYLRWSSNPALTFLRIRTRLGTSPSLSRPSIEPVVVAERLRSFMTG
jgi:phosphonopyruvate decarboxylase